MVLLATSHVKKEGLRVITLRDSKASHDSGPVLVWTKITHAGGDIDTASLRQREHAIAHMSYVAHCLFRGPTPNESPPITITNPQCANVPPTTTDS